MGAAAATDAQTSAVSTERKVTSRFAKAFTPVRGPQERALRPHGARESGRHLSPVGGSAEAQRMPVSIEKSALTILPGLMRIVTGVSRRPVDLTV